MTLQEQNRVRANYNKLRDKIEIEDRAGEDVSMRDEFEKLDYELGSRQMGFVQDCDPELAGMTTEQLKARCTELAKILDELPL